MSLSIVFRNVAVEEFDSAFDWYEQRQAGLGELFVAEVHRVVRRVSEAPRHFPEVHRDVRRAVVRRFPYCIYFKVEPHQVVVLAVFHAKRDPSTWPPRT